MFLFYVTLKLYLRSKYLNSEALRRLKVFIGAAKMKTLEPKDVI